MKSIGKPQKREKAGRPPAVIDWGKVSRYLQAQCQVKEIAGLLGISVDTFYIRCKTDNNMDFSTWAQEKKAEGLELLRAKQFDTAMSGDRTMLIWLGKQLLGQREQVEQTIRMPELKMQPIDSEEQAKISESIRKLNEINDDLSQKH